MKRHSKRTSHVVFSINNDYLRAPLRYFVNTCICTVLLWDTGKETYIVFMKRRYTNVKKTNKKSLLLLKKKSSRLLECANFFASKCILSRSINYCCTLLVVMAKTT